MHVIESRVQGKHSSSTCEDALFIGEHFVVLIDGASSRDTARAGRVAPGRRAALALADAAAALRPDADARAAVDHLTTAIAALGDPAASAAVGICSRSRRELWQIGDVAVWCEGDSLVPPAPKVIDDVASSIRSSILRDLLDRGVPQEELLAEDPARRAISSILSRQLDLQNASGPWTYGAICADPLPDEHLMIRRLPASPTEVVMHSDGYPVPAPTLEEAEAHRERLVTQDPLCIGALIGTKGVQPGNTSFDDRSYVRLRL